MSEKERANIVEMCMLMNQLPETKQEQLIYLAQGILIGHKNG